MMSFISPFSIACLIFSVNAFLYLVFIDSGSFFAFYTMVMFVISSLLYYFLGKKLVFNKNSVINLHHKISVKLIGHKFVLLLGVVCGVFSLLILIIKSGQSDPLLIASHYSHLRYVEEIGMPIEVRISNVFLYFSLIISLLIFFEKKKKSEKSFLYLMPSILLFLQSLLLGTKSIIIMLAIYMFITYLIVAMYYGEEIKAKFLLKKSLFFGLLLISLVTIVHFVRAQGNLGIGDIIQKIATSYFLIPSFAFFSDSGQIDYLFNFGFYSISGLSVYLFDDIVKQGNFIFFDVFDGVYQTNVYTALFYLVKDFGHIGFILIILAILVLMVFLEKQIRNGVIYGIFLYIPVSAYLLFAFADPVFKELTNILSYLILMGYVGFCSLVYSRRK